MASSETNYRRLDSTDDEGGDSPSDEQGYLVHVADGNKARWHHIEDLDAFFTRVYYYHQNHGFGCIMLQQCFELFQFVFIVGFAAFLLRCVDYDLLFGDKPYLNQNETERIELSDVVYVGHQCSERIGESVPLVIILIIASVFWAVRVIRVLFNFFRLSEIRAFYSTALHIKPNDLDNTTWHEVQRRLMMVQTDQQMCIHKQDLTELDIYHRILRFKNYMIAMVNKEVLPMRYRLPFFGDTVFLTHGLKFNLELILFWGPWSLFANNYNLKEEYKRRSNRDKLIARLSNQFWWAGLVNLLLSPVILVWQLLYSFFSYTEILRREPGTFGARKWSMYSRLYLRHFNELSHEFQARLSRGYSPSTKYMNSFHSPFLTVIAKNFAFLFGSVFAVLFVLALWDQDVLRLEHVVRTTFILGLIATISRSMIPDENAVFCPEQLMKKVLSQVHYVPGSWHGRAHTQQVRDQFAQLFQYKASHILEEILSPMVTPFVLMFAMRRHSAKMIDFFRNFTVDITGVGDVCSFAQMDVRRHGDPKWQVTTEKQSPTPSQPAATAEGGKTELSLMHFAITNPKWKPPQSEDKFLNNLKEQAHRDALTMSRREATQNPLLTSMQSLGSIGIPQASFLQQPAMSCMMSTVSPNHPMINEERKPEQSIMEESVPPESLPYEESMMTSSISQQPMTRSKKPAKKPKLKGGAKQEGDMEGSGLGLISSVIAGHQGMPLNSKMSRSTAPQQSVFASTVGGNVFGLTPCAELTPQGLVELAPVEMGISALYMHELYHNRLVQEDRTANWESVGENLPPGSYHSDNISTGPSSGQYQAPSIRGHQEQSTSHDPTRPLLTGSRSDSQPQILGQNYNTLSPQSMFPESNLQDPRTSSSSHMAHQPFMTLNQAQHPRTYPDKQQLTSRLMSPTENVNLASDSDEEAPHEFHLPVQEPTSSSALADLPSIGVPPAYHEDRIPSPKI